MLGSLSEPVLRVTKPASFICFICPYVTKAVVRLPLLQLSCLLDSHLPVFKELIGSFEKDNGDYSSGYAIRQLLLAAFGIDKLHPSLLHPIDKLHVKSLRLKSWLFAQATAADKQPKLLSELDAQNISSYSHEDLLLQATAAEEALALQEQLDANIKPIEFLMMPSSNGRIVIKQLSYNSAVHPDTKWLKITCQKHPRGKLFRIVESSDFMITIGCNVVETGNIQEIKPGQTTCSKSHVTWRKHLLEILKGGINIKESTLFEVYSKAVIRNVFPPCEWLYFEPPVPAFDKLNRAQKDAFQYILCDNGGPFRPITGPPGTGKTRLIAAVLQQCASAHPDRAVLVTSQNNTAVQNVAGALQGTGLPFVIFVSYNYYKWFPEIYRPFLSSIMITGSSLDSVKKINRNGDMQHTNTAKIFLCTADSVSSTSVLETLVDPKVHTIIIDEASQSRHGQMLSLPFSLGPSVEVVVPIGDPHQLPPYGHDIYDSAKDSETSMKITSICDSHAISHASVFLEEQFRYPSLIAEFLVYSGRLLSNASKNDREGGCLRRLFDRQ